MKAALHENQDMRRLAAGWLLLALAALTLSVACAVLLVMARAPLPGGFAASIELFRSALVLHVGFAVVVWFLSAAAGLWTLAAGGAGHLRWAALGMAGAGAVAMVAAPLFGSPVPVLSNYVPVLDSPMFLAGLVWFIAGIALCGAASAGDMVRRLRGGQAGVWRIGVLLSIFAATVALGSFVMSLVMAGTPANPVDFEILLWGPGHLLQFIHVLLLMTVWIVLGERALSDNMASCRQLTGLLLLAALPLLAAPFIHAFYPAGSADFRQAFTSLMTWGSWPAAVLLAGSLLWRLARSGRAAWAQAETPALILSILLFLLGCIFGASIRGETTMVPAHYHGTVGAVTLAYMALGYRLLPAFGVVPGTGRLMRWQPAIYGAGLLILSSSLAWSGWLGVPRKTMHVELAAQSPAYLAAMGLAGLGGLLSVAGAALFIFNMMRSIRQSRPKNAPRAPLRDIRWRTLALTVGLTVSGGLLLAVLPGKLHLPAGKAIEDSRAVHAREKTDAEIARRFGQGVAMLHARRYDDALTAFHRVLELAPEMPEAYVNTGFALIGLEHYAVARDFFESAIELRRDQVNAYYGLAVALEGMDDVSGALGAMRTYLHLAPADDAYRRKAESAVWEWEEKLKRARSTTRKAKPDSKTVPAK